MRNIWTIAVRELKHYFSSPIAYVVALVIVLVVGTFFSLYLILINQAAYSYSGSVPAPSTSIIISPMSLVLLFAIPAITMRLLADEQRMGTLELLLTAPVRDSELVVGKWLGAFLFTLIIIAITLIYPLTLHLIEDPGIDWGVMISGYLGIILMAAALLAIGTAISSIFSNQFAAFFVTFMVALVLWWVIGWPASVFDSNTNVQEIFNYLNVNAHVGSMMEGQGTVGGIVYLLSLSALGLFIGSAVIETRRWR